MDMGIAVKLEAGDNVAISSILANGRMGHVITDNERGLFGLDDNALKQAIKAYFGRAPNDVYLRSPAREDDLYKKYGWSQVQIVMVAQKAQILEVNSKPSIIQSVHLKNNSKKKGTFEANTSSTVSNTFETSWSSTNNVSFSQEINYAVEFLGLKAGGATTLSVSQSFGKGESKSEAFTVGSSQGVSVDLDPNESVDVLLMASRGILKARVFFNAYLTGSTVVNYNPIFKGHHFWALDIGAVMKAGGIKNSIAFTEDIELNYYSNASVQLSDATKRVMNVAGKSDGVEKLDEE